MEQHFACLQVIKERKMTLTTLSFQGNAMYWWTTLKMERRINSPRQV